jgi:hypothetical protein
MVTICDGCAFNVTDCILKPRVKKAGGKVCSSFASGPARKTTGKCKTTWPTSDGRLVVKTWSNGKETIRRITAS